VSQNEVFSTTVHDSAVPSNQLYNSQRFLGSETWRTNFRPTAGPPYHALMHSPWPESDNWIFTAWRYMPARYMLSPCGRPSVTSRHCIKMA